MNDDFPDPTLPTTAVKEPRATRIEILLRIGGVDETVDTAEYESFPRERVSSLGTFSSGV